MEIKIKALSGRSDLMKFIKCEWNFYKDDKYWVPPLILDRAKTLDTKKNPFFKHSVIQLFIAERNGEIVGRIAPLINSNHNKTHNDRVGFFGFFECIDDQEVANKLFDTAAQWVSDRGMDTLRGPLNPSMNDVPAMLYEGFDSIPMIMMPYNQKYHIKLYENYSFEKAQDLLGYYLDQNKYMTDKLKRIQQIVRQRYDITVRNVNLKDKEQFKRDLQTMKDIYNSAWVPNWGFVRWTDEEFDFLAEDMKQTADPELAFIVESKGKPAGFAFGMPNLNQILYYNRTGRLIPFLWHYLTKKKKMTWMRIIALGIIPEFHQKGIDSVMYYELGTRSISKGWVHGDASWLVESNVMINRAMVQVLNGELYKKFRIWEKKI
jgi:hypothetical protein